MRLWHKNLLPVLPRQQLVAQWRELSAIAGKISLTGSPNHILVNPIMDYPLNHFTSYAILVYEELKKRNYRPTQKVLDKIVGIADVQDFIPRADIFPSWHDQDYLRICLTNLEEKAACGGISPQEW